MSARIGAVVRSFGAAVAALFFSLAAVAQIGGGGPILGATNANLHSPGPIGDVTPSTGAFTTLSGTTVTATTKFLSADGAAGAPSHSFTNDTTTGCYRNAANNILCGTSVGVASPGANTTAEFSAASAATGNTHILNLKAGAAASSGSIHFYTIGVDRLQLNTNGTLASGTTANDVAIASFVGGGVTGSGTTSTFQFGTTWNTSGVVAGMIQANITNTGSGAGSRILELQRGGAIQFGVTSGAASTGLQVRTAQATAPTCTTNCGTPGNVCTGTDTAMICTMGTTPASGVLITFNGTWAAAPSCVVQMALAGMVVGKQVLTAATTTTTITLVTNGTAPVAGDKYAIICVGVS